MALREFKVIRLNQTGDKLYEDNLMFEDYEACERWCEAQNEERPGSVVDMEEIHDYGHSEFKYEY